MADAELRALERNARETGDPKDEARWLAACERAGAIDRRGIELAAYLGHAGACEITGRTGFETIGSSGWFANLAYFGGEAVLRAGVALARARLATWNAEEPGDSRPARAVEAAEAWARDPTDLRARAAIEPAIEAERARAATAGRPVSAIAALAATACRVAADHVDPLEGGREPLARRRSAELSDAVRAIDPFVPDAARRALLAWALGRDPLRAA